MNEKLQPVSTAADYIRERISRTPRIGMILGSGLGVLGDEVEDAVVLDYGDIPHFPVSTVEGHAGKLVIGRLEGCDVVVLQGRFHYYEGYTMDEVVFPVRVMKLLGIESLIVTNAAGGVNTSFSVGDLMIISDHIKFFTDSPLRGANIAEFGPRFNDMGNAYTASLRDLAHSVAAEQGISIREGVYAHMPGPSFETPAEIRMLRTLGADAVGMSTVPEVITAAHAGLDVLGISAISNMAAGVLDQPLNHKEVMAMGLRMRDMFVSFIRGVLKKVEEVT